MTMTGSAIAYQRFRVPREHGEILAVPSLDEVPRLVAENRSLHDGWQGDCQGRCLGDLARQARHDLWRAATHYTRNYRDRVETASPETDTPILLTGHQPELYHPGVWIKNFAISSAAQKWNARAVHLIIDNDTATSAAIRIPDGTLQKPRFGTVAYDQPSSDTPYEDRPVLDSSAFASFGDRVRERLAPFVADPLIERFWPRAVAAADMHGNLGRAVAQARHEQEASWGLTTCELPLSQVCEQESFRWFVVHVLGQLPRFRDAHNSSLAEYRRVHRLRSRTHPVPELVRQDEWLEAPFWIWSAADPRRERLFVRRRGRQLEISDSKQSLGFLSLHADGPGEAAVDELFEWSARGYRLRPRALLTTMFARLFLGDLFVHGVGGAKYDQLTDVIIQRFFQITPPAFLVLTATAKLPVQRTRATSADVRRLDGLLRELQFNPQRHVPLNSQTEPWLAAKQQWIADEGPAVDRRSRHGEMVRINEGLQPFVAKQRHQLLRQRAEYVSQIGRDRVLGTREYAFCLFPEETLRDLLLDI
ncbi:MAG: hypothetical protein ACC628_05195 [Pirellulaceae bacterium]